MDARTITLLIGLAIVLLVAASWLRSRKSPLGDEKEGMKYPPVMDPSSVGTYSASTKTGGGYVWDAVLEYRVWCHPERGAPDEANGSDYYYPFASYEEAEEFSAKTTGAEEPLALVLQREYIGAAEPTRHSARHSEVACEDTHYLKAQRRLAEPNKPLQPTAPTSDAPAVRWR
jgi:hypothetical protein